MISETENKADKMQVVALQPGDPDSHIKHVSNFIASVKSRQSPVCEIETGHNVALVAHMGNIAYKTGSRLHWDETKGAFRDDPKANALLRPEYRAPWKWPA